ncbi:sensor histidine kinase [Paenibacillus radicis (ex Xue et al. 2023)]|uniref:Sensor histidine kinase n=1 Tax=Paenibacillus radicis (ex Xue et al. 2023) TaxID=2972489 RepID=A0ABT1YEM4_9BACL|nr:sensor histidine kinase [Paenibacillus radicis (ex Xue et al. 2023)]MCR8630673.1 sensor histidine kinase [Paenibacillus radicis (ex Xue et al. 2023)]
MRRWNDRMLKIKMFISFSIVALFIVGITCIIFYYKNTSDVKNQTFSLSKIIAKQFSEMIDLYMQNIEELSLSISIDPAIQSNLFDFFKATNPIEKETIGYKLNPVLFNFSYPKSYVQSISIYTLDGHGYHYTKVVNHPRPSQVFTNEELRNFTDVLSGKPFLLKPSNEERTFGDQSEAIVSFIHKITKIPTQTIIGFVSIDIDINAFKMVLANKEANESNNAMHVLLVSDEGQVIFENWDQMTGLLHADFDTAVFKRTVPEGELQWNNKLYLYTYEKSAYTGWNTVILIPKDVILLKQKKVQDIVIIVGIITMLLIAAVSYLLSHQITLPLNNLMRKMSRVELGDFSQRMEYAGNNEIGRLSRMYNLMLDSMSRLIKEVYESKLAEKNAQLSALHAQINPHFLYNTLNIMKSISRLRGVEEVAEISESLASLFQYSMKNLHQPVSLLEEIDHINNYFKIQQHRFGNRVELQCDIPNDHLQASILKLTIQPLIENAVNHGLRRMKSGGCITIHTTKCNELLTITVTDNGEGMTDVKQAQLSKALDISNMHYHFTELTHGVGLINIHQRIQLFYGKQYGLSLFSKPGGGTKVTLVIPFLIVQQEEGGIA